MNEVERKVLNFFETRSLFLKQEEETEKTKLSKVGKYLKSHPHIWRIYRKLLENKKRKILRRIMWLKKRIIKISFANLKLEKGEKTEALKLLEEMSRELPSIIDLGLVENQSMIYINLHFQLIRNMEQELISA